MLSEPITANALIAFTPIACRFATTLPAPPRDERSSRTGRVASPVSSEDSDATMSTT